MLLEKVSPIRDETQDGRIARTSLCNYFPYAHCTACRSGTAGGDLQGIGGAGLPGADAAVSSTTSRLKPGLCLFATSCTTAIPDPTSFFLSMTSSLILFDSLRDSGGGAGRATVTFVLGLRDREIVRAILTSAAGLTKATIVGPGTMAESLPFAAALSVTGDAEAYLDCGTLLVRVVAGFGMVEALVGCAGRWKLDDRGMWGIVSVLERIGRTGRRPVWRTRSSVVCFGAYFERGMYFESFTGTDGRGGDCGEGGVDIGNKFFGENSSELSSTGEGTLMFRPSTFDLREFFLLPWIGIVSVVSSAIAACLQLMSASPASVSVGCICRVWSTSVSLNLCIEGEVKLSTIAIVSSICTEVVLTFLSSSDSGSVGSACGGHCFCCILRAFDFERANWTAAEGGRVISKCCPTCPLESRKLLISKNISL